eukprot:542247_1
MKLQYLRNLLGIVVLACVCQLSHYVEAENELGTTIPDDLSSMEGFQEKVDGRNGEYRPGNGGGHRPGKPGHDGGHRPPHYRPPHYRPPHYRPPHYRPPHYRPPYYRPPHYRPPHYSPPYYPPHYRHGKKKSVDTEMELQEMEGKDVEHRGYYGR